MFGSTRKILHTLKTPLVLKENTKQVKNNFVSIYEAVEKLTKGLKEGVVPDVTKGLDEIQKKLYEIAVKNTPESPEEMPDYKYLGASGQDNFYAKIEQETETGKVNSISVKNAVDEEMVNKTNDENKTAAQIISDAVDELRLDSVSFQLLLDLGIIDLAPEQEEIQPASTADSSLPGTQSQTPPSNPNQPPPIPNNQEKMNISASKIKGHSVSWATSLKDAVILAESKKDKVFIPEGQYQVIESGERMSLIAQILKEGIVSSKVRFMVSNEDTVCCGDKNTVKKEDTKKVKEGKINEDRQLVKAKYVGSDDTAWVNDPFALKTLLTDQNSPEAVLVFVENGRQEVELLSHMQGEEILVGEETIKIPLQGAVEQPIEAQMASPDLGGMSSPIPSPSSNPIVGSEPIIDEPVSEEPPIEVIEPEETDIEKEEDEEPELAAEGKNPDVTKGEPQTYIKDLLEKHGVSEDIGDLTLELKQRIDGLVDRKKVDMIMKLMIEVEDDLQNNDGIDQQITREWFMKELFGPETEHMYEDKQAEPSQGTPSDDNNGKKTANISKDGEGKLDNTKPKQLDEPKDPTKNSSPSSVNDAGGKANISKEGEGSLDNTEKPQGDKPKDPKEVKGEAQTTDASKPSNQGTFEKKQTALDQIESIEYDALIEMGNLIKKALDYGIGKLTVEEKAKMEDHLQFLRSSAIKEQVKKVEEKKEEPSEFTKILDETAKFHKIEVQRKQLELLTRLLKG